MPYRTDMQFVDSPHDGRICHLCFEDTGLNSEDYVWMVSSRVLLTCDKCGETNDEVEE